MSDIDGRDAFEMLLARLHDVIGQNHKLQTQKHEVDALLNRSRNDLANQTRETSRLQNELGKLNQRENTALPKLAELHQAALEALPHLVSVSGVRDRLTKAAQEAGPFCDEIPF